MAGLIADEWIDERRAGRMDARKVGWYLGGWMAGWISGRSLARWSDGCIKGWIE